MQADYLSRWIYEREWMRDEHEREALRARVARAEDASAKRLDRLEDGHFKPR